MLLSALAGGASPHSSPSRWSAETIAFGCWSRIANSERCLTPPSATARAPSLTSRGPSTRKSMGGSGRQYCSPAHAASLIRPALETDYNGIERARAVPRVGLMRERPLVLDGSTALCATGRRSLALTRGAQVLTGAGLAPACDEEHARRQV